MTRFKKTGIAALAALTLSSGPALAAGGEAHIEDIAFSFEGPFGKFDQNQLQRGLKVYTAVCASCHGMEYVPIRTLGDEGGPHLPMDQVRAYAEQNFEVFDEELDDFRAAKPVDHFPSSSLETAPDLSLMAKKRAGFHGPYGTGLSQLFNGMGGAEYIYSLMTGYAEAPDCAPDDFPGSYNTAFTAGGYPAECKDHGHPTVPGSWISMARPLWGEDVEYDDGTEATMEQEAEDVAAFLMWAAEPKMMARKEAGLSGVIFLTVLTVLLYLTNKRLWAPIKGKKNV
ncbi:cytochrome c1 [Roseovarius sp. TE539]|uniref:cytochrome c1 n=1 Tax=Roseovarius sp. TE539 TaxID=2249812 RepID=UPI000DE069BF|nr:cytochrome c1 [Roseovarius sp. TE539]RBI67307.1 cytochrome c1 [Roseovarius sp. TE539]